MVRKYDTHTWKASYFVKLTRLLDEYPKCFIVAVDNVGSKQMQQIRESLRGHAELLMGKNTMIRKVIRGYSQKNPDLEKLLPHMVGNVGFVFTKEDLSDTKAKILANRVAAPAKAGTLAPIDVRIEGHNTGLGPEKTNFFQALNIPTKISRGTIEILNGVQIITKGDKVGASEAALLQMLGVRPFSYGLVITRVYDSGTCFEPEILDITTDILRARFLEGVGNVAALSMSIKYPTMASVPHSIAKGLQNILAIAAVTEITFKEAQQMKEFLADPSKLAAVLAVAAAPEAAAEKPKEAEKAPDSEESGDEDMGFGLFD